MNLWGNIMYFSFDEEKLPDTYMRDGKKYYLDPIRKKLVQIMLEETVRQKWIHFIRNKMSVPENLISVESHLSHYGIKSKRRADIIIHGNDEKGTVFPLCVVECKAPDIPLTENTQNQVFDYCDEVGADYAIMSNGYYTDCYKYDKDKKRYVRLSEIPSFEELLGGKYIEYDWGEFPERTPFDELERALSNGSGEGYIGNNTPKEIALVAYNLLECFLDYHVKMPEGNYGMFRLIQDYGVRMLSYGNSAGGIFSGPYRSFLIDINGNTEFVSLSVSAYFNYSSPDIEKTALNVAIDNEENSHHALQLVMDKDVEVYNDVYDFYHSGRIAIGNIGSGKISELRTFVKRHCPQLIDENKFYLGSLKNNRLWRLDDPEVVNLISNLIAYSLIRDEYRKYRKSKN